MLADAAKLKIGSGPSQTQYGICERPDWQAEYNPVLKAYGVTGSPRRQRPGQPGSPEGMGPHDRPDAEW